ncbi:molecular chaperone DnaJ, partial [Bacillus cereus]|nr:molecular chaperone DnaJ [Bacillus cereus]
MVYFQSVTTLEELKKQYKKLAKKHHPDLGGK